MSTFLFDDIVFGPVQSRRLGVSLGVNLLPTNSKVCTFDCIYCECGWTDKGENVGVLPKREQVVAKLESILSERKQNNLPIDAITFAGNGEPTMHPNFAEIINDTVKLRQKYYPEARISVLSNATLIHRPKVFHALQLVDDNILKLDSGIEETIRKINCPLGSFNLEKLITDLEAFEGGLTLQTMFIRGEYEGASVDNTTKDEIEQWLNVLKRIKPNKIMVYTIARDTAAEGIIAVSKIELEEIAEKARALGFEVQVSA
ncbi:MAG: radical SAM protein [Salinivirgaceae bacterium]|nr:MAG: radical SAM protein [Salinivirgaceae bacterium]